MTMTKTNLWNLRTEITLGSLYTSDYENTFRILPIIVQNFFDGYIEYIWELAEEGTAKENNKKDMDFEDLVEIYDNADNLERWYYCFDEDPLPTYVEVLEPLFAKEGYHIEINNDIEIDNDTITFYKTAPKGLDFSFEVDIGCDIEDFLDIIDNYYQNFDVSYETYLWLDNTGHGKNGAPYGMEDVLEDMKACEQYINDIAWIVNDFIEKEVK